MLRMRFDQISGPSVRIRVGFDYTITGGEGTPFFDQVEQVVDRVLDRQFHGGAPDLLPMIWDAIKATVPKVELVRLDPAPEAPATDKNWVPIIY